MVRDLWVFINEQLMLLQISPTLMCRYDKAFGAAELSTPQILSGRSVEMGKKKKKVTPLPFWHKSDLYPPDVFSLSV